MRSHRAAHPSREDRDHQLEERCLDTGIAAAGTLQTEERFADRCLSLLRRALLWPLAWVGSRPRGISHSCHVKLSAAEKHDTTRRHNPALKFLSELEDQLASLSVVLIACRWCSPRVADVHRRCRQPPTRHTKRSRNVRHRSQPTSPTVYRLCRVEDVQHDPRLRMGMRAALSRPATIAPLLPVVGDPTQLSSVRQDWSIANCVAPALCNRGQV